jgi:hypothetical protein
MDRRYLARIAEHHNGGPVGIETLAAALAESRDTLEEVRGTFPYSGGLGVAHPARARARGSRLAAFGLEPARRACSPCWICSGIRKRERPHLWALRVDFEDTDAGALPITRAICIGRNARGRKPCAPWVCRIRK